MELQEAWSVTLWEIEGIHQIASRNNIPFLLLIAPYMFQLDDPEKNNQPQNVLKRYCLKNKTPVLDLLPYFSTYRKKNNIPLFVDANHFSSAGHGVAAEELAKKTLQLLKQTNSSPQRDQL